MALRLGVAIVSMNRPQVLRSTISRLTGHPRLQQDLMVIVDNGSTNPETLGLLETQASEGWQIIRNATNQGLSRAVNQGLAILAANPNVQLFLHLDDDALLPLPTDPWLDVVEDVMTNCPELGVLVPNAENYGEHIPQPRYRELRWALGFCWALRRETYDMIGGYDTQLLHQQECDFALRARMAGYTVGAPPGFRVHHNDPGGTARSDLSLAREHLGVVQFRDKWASYYRGRGWNYGTFPVYLMQHWPLDVDWYDRFARANGVELNPDMRRDPTGAGIAEPHNSIVINGVLYYKRFMIVQDGGHWETMREAHVNDRALAIQRWFELTGEHYDGYRWPMAVPFRVVE